MDIRLTSGQSGPRVPAGLTFQVKRSRDAPSHQRMKGKTVHRLPVLIDRHSPPGRPRGFTLTEMLVVAAIVAAFVAMMFVVVGKVYEVIRSWD